VATVYYPAIIERGRRGYGVFFPDLPGCTSAGDTVTEAAVNAEEALMGHLLVCEEHGDELAEPSALDAIEIDPDVEEVARILVRGERRGKAVRINITLDEGLVAAIDRVAENRSGFLADAARAALAARRENAGT
jgi:predicted RNase H-like HicB family nuclease